MSLKIKYEELRQSNLKTTFEVFERSFNKIGIDFYVIGALARDTWFSTYDIEIIGTRDVDFAIYISTEEKYEQLINHLITNEGYTNSKENKYVVFSPEGVQVDLLPFGKIQVEGKVMIETESLSTIAINGYQEVYEAGTIDVNFEDDTSFKVCTIPSIVLLKFISYDDRPEIRTKDIFDISIILKFYFEIESNRIYEKHNDLFEYTTELNILAARVLGREMKPILSRSVHLENRIKEILKTEINKKSNSKIAELLVLKTNNTIEYALNILKEIYEGICE